MALVARVFYLGFHFCGHHGAYINGLSVRLRSVTYLSGRLPGFVWVFLGFGTASSTSLAGGLSLGFIDFIWNFVDSASVVKC